MGLRFRLRILHVLALTLCVCVAVKRRFAISYGGGEEIPSASSYHVSPSTANYTSSSSPEMLLQPRVWLSHPTFLPSTTQIAGLEYAFNRESCPKAEQIVREVVEEIMYRVRPEVAQILLRFLFQDCFILGCDASVLLDSTEGMASLPNENFRGFVIIDIIKSKLEENCPGIDSCAELIVLAARDCGSLFGGPFYPVYTGKRGRSIQFSNREKDGVSSSLDHLSELLASLAVKGFDGRKIVTLLGAQSIRGIHGKFFENRLYNFNRANEPHPHFKIVRTCHDTPSGSESKASQASTSYNFSTEELGIPLIRSRYHHKENNDRLAFAPWIVHPLVSSAKGTMHESINIPARIQTESKVKTGWLKEWTNYFFWFATLLLLVIIGLSSIQHSLRNPGSRYQEHSFPVNDGSIKGDKEKCCICQFEYEEGDKLVSTSCQHVFHSQCFKNFLRANGKNCPYCKGVL